MPIHRFEAPRGRVETIEIDSRALAGNLLRDPARRAIAVYLPEGYDRSGADYPLVVVLSGFTGSGLKQLAWRPFGESLPQRIDRLIAEGRMGPVVAALPDGFTSLGGNQYIDSVAMGRWEAFLLEELLPRLERDFRVRPGARHRAVVGKSSGGYGALVQGLEHGEQWAAVACHSGDIGFDTVYRRDLPLLVEELGRHGGDVGAFLDRLAGAPKIRSREMLALMLLAMSASYDPDPAAPRGIRLPCDPSTGEIVPARWERWLAHDPLTLVERADCQARLRRLAALFIDCGSRDQYFCHHGARAFVRRLAALGIPHRYEEFEDDHSDVDYRMDVSLPLLYAALDGVRS
jgi:S-formylglutathione hydrolase FrmB